MLLVPPRQLIQRRRTNVHTRVVRMLIHLFLLLLPHQPVPQYLPIVQIYTLYYVKIYPIEVKQFIFEDLFLDCPLSFTLNFLLTTNGCLLVVYLPL